MTDIGLVFLSIRTDGRLVDRIMQLSVVWHPDPAGDPTFRLYEEKPSLVLKSSGFAVAMIPAFLSGITNENTAGGMILMMLLFCLLYYKRKIRVSRFTMSRMRRPAAFWS